MQSITGSTNNWSSWLSWLTLTAHKNQEYTFKYNKQAINPLNVPVHILSSEIDHNFIRYNTYQISWKGAPVEHISRRFARHIQNAETVARLGLPERGHRLEHILRIPELQMYTYETGDKPQVFNNKGVQIKITPRRTPNPGHFAR
ncbi:11290_t:CDS:2 [Gigaspora margarita]|uniref:11290_t:CDS:1 n=1 Tax=Gigaspora margarita TaxID=4874 RepID=A0ABN7UQV9_GIGMA|nr:11290_t:CDS:2 [Gigaspora margarita]